MKRHIFTAIFLCTAASAFAQEPGARGGGRGPAPQPPPPLFFKETWKQAPGNVPVTQDFVTNPDLKLDLYGTGIAYIRNIYSNRRKSIVSPYRVTKCLRPC